MCCQRCVCCNTKQKEEGSHQIKQHCNRSNGVRHVSCVYLLHSEHGCPCPSRLTAVPPTHLRECRHRSPPTTRPEVLEQVERAQLSASFNPHPFKVWQACTKASQQHLICDLSSRTYLPAMLNPQSWHAPCILGCILHALCAPRQVAAPEYVCVVCCFISNCVRQ